MYASDEMKRIKKSKRRSKDLLKQSRCRRRTQIRANQPKRLKNKTKISHAKNLAICLFTFVIYASQTMCTHNQFFEIDRKWDPKVQTNAKQSISFLRF